jgi:hypothetical protein
VINPENPQTLLVPSDDSLEPAIALLGISDAERQTDECER